MGADPARAYLFDGGVVVFGQRQRAGQSNDALIVNLWTQDRSAAAPWSLRQLEAYLAEHSGAANSSSSANSSGGSSSEAGGSPGSDSSARSSGDSSSSATSADGVADAVRRLRSRLHAGVAASLAAALPSVRRSTAALPGYQGGSFEVLGVDFLVDASLRPWLVEVNFLPSMARKLVGCNASHASAAAAGGSGSSASGSAGGSLGPSAGACQRDNPFDVQKERFVRALLGLLAERHRQLAPAERQAQRVLAAAAAAAGEGEGAPCADGAQLRQLAALRGEQAAAEALGFVPLTELVYRCLECAASRHMQSSAGAEASEATSSSGMEAGGSECAVLAELAVPPSGPRQHQAKQQCSAPASRAERLLAEARHWRERLLLEGAALAPWVLNPRARWRAAYGTPAPPPFPMPPADRRVLAWLRRGSPPIDSQQALHDFCAAAAA